MLIEWLLLGICVILMAVDFLEYRQLLDLGRKYVSLEEWSEDRILENVKQIRELEEKHEFLEKRTDEMMNMLPKDGNGEIIRNNVLLRQMNDEMEKSLNMERQFNDGLSSILNYGKPINHDEVT